MKRFVRSAFAVAASFGLVLAGSATASASTFGADSRSEGSTLSIFRLSSLNDSGARGFGIVRLEGNEANVRLYAFGMLPGSPHAQHFHIDGAGRCPTEADDANGDGIVSTVEGQQDYGSVGASLTTSGDTSPTSALAVKRFPTADNGFVRYQRTFHVSDAVAQDIRTGNAVIVTHGIDTNGNGKYDFSAGNSALNPALPLEATAPAACGNQTLVLSTGSGGLGLGLGLGLDMGFGRN